MFDQKRKRDDPDDEEIALGRQVLPVANLPADFSGEPEDGLQYLFMVRRDARQLPHVTRVPNPYEQPESSHSEEAIVSSSKHLALPSLQWRQQYETRFRNFRKNMSQPTIRVTAAPASKLMPDKKERDHWWAFLAGKSESDWNPPKKTKQYKHKYMSSMRAFADDPAAIHQVPLLHEDNPRKETWRINEDGDVELDQDDSEGGPSAPVPRVEDLKRTTPKGLEPTPTLIQHIDERMALHLLMYFAHWMKLYVDEPETSTLTPTQSHSRWIFSLLARVEDYVSADDMSHLRSLARACIALIKMRLQRLGAEDMISDTSCWMIIATIAQLWAQRDLWTDAEEMLRSVSPIPE